MIRLHGSAGSPFVARVLLQLEAKGVAYDLVLPAMGTPEFLKLNPIGKMPVLEQDGFALPESAVIMEYVEETCSGPSLLGEDARTRARVRLMGRVLDLYCGGSFELLWAASDPTHKIDADVTRDALNKGLDAVEAFLDGRSWAIGDRMTLADCTLASWLFYARMLPQIGFDIEAGRPKLARYIAFLGEQAEVKTMWTRMDEAFRAFLARRAAEAEAAAKV